MQASKLKQPPKRYNIAHRGARSLAPENTMAAFRKALEVGAHGCETDVSVTQDGKLVLFHDTSLLRTTDVAVKFPSRKKEPLHTFTLEELKTLDAGSWFITEDPFGTIRDRQVCQDELESFSGLAIPSLDDLLAFVKQNSWFVNIEIKPLADEIGWFNVVDQVLDGVESAALSPEMFSISSFHHPFIDQVAARDKGIEINALIGGSKILPQRWGNYRYPIYNANIRRTSVSDLKKAHDHGCQVNLYTVNDQEDMVTFLRAGAQKIITDFPQHLAAIPPDEVFPPGKDIPLDRKE